MRRCAGAAAIGAFGGYAWWASGLRPFTALGTGAVAVPVGVVAALAVLDRPVGASASAGVKDRRSARGWLVLLAAAVALESLGLAVGGRSRSAPTLSTVLDHGLSWYATRFALFWVWLAIGSGAARRLLRHRPRVRAPGRS